jgi:protein SCO1/2
MRSKAQAPLPLFQEVVPFELTDQRGNRFSSASLSGRVWVLDFFFSSCPGPCPTMTAHLASLQKRFGSRISLVSISVDPQRDDPATLASYAKRKGAAQDWHFLTGSEDLLRRMVRHEFKVAAGEPLLAHSQKFLLVDQQGRIRGYYEGTSAAELEELIRDIRQLLH